MTKQTQNAFRALADPTRRDILMMLGAQDMTIAQVSDRFDMTRAAVKKHLTVLSDGGLILALDKGRDDHLMRMRVDIHEGDLWIIAPPL